MVNCFEGWIDLIPLNKEKYISFTKDIEGSSIKLRFIDTLRFMNSSLDKLAKDVEELKIVKEGFPGVESEKFKLLCRKGIYPYEYIDSRDKLKERQLPPREQFYNSLNGTSVSQEDY